MGTLPRILTPSDDSAVDCRPATPSQRDLALSMLLNGSEQLDRLGVDRFMRFASEQSLSLDHLWIAQRGGRPVTAVLLSPNAGRTAMLFAPPVDDRTDREALASLAGAACRSLSSDEVQLVQALLDPHASMDRDVLIAAGFQPLATLTYMQRRGQRRRTLQLDDRFEVRHWHESHRNLFERGILQSYEGTQDCPALLGLREIDDIIAGHMNTGEFNAALWYLVTCGNEPAAVMLLNRVPSRHALELVYLGVAPAYRGEGLGKALLQHALGLPAQHRAVSVILAVDDANEPAKSLYQSLRFSATGRKDALIFQVMHDV